MKSRILTVFLLTVLWSLSSADEYRKKINEGYEYYRNGEYDKAAEFYRQAGILKPDKALPKIGKGASLYRENDFQAAGKEFAGILDRRNDRTRADALYNIGNSRFRSEDYENAARSYIEALKIRPDDPDYKHNLEMALIRQQQQQQQQQQNQENDDDQDKQNQQQQDQKEKGDQEKEKDQQQENQQTQQDKQEQNRQDQQQQQRQDQEQQQQPQVADEQRMTEEEAKNLLARFEEDEKDIQRELKQVNLRGGSGRDW